MNPVPRPVRPTLPKLTVPGNIRLFLNAFYFIAFSDGEGGLTMEWMQEVVEVWRKTHGVPVTYSGDAVASLWETTQTYMAASFETIREQLLEPKNETKATGECMARFLGDLCNLQLSRNEEEDRRKNSKKGRRQTKKKVSDKRIGKLKARKCSVRSFFPLLLFRADN